MQGDIMQPEPKKPRQASKPKPQKSTAGPQPDFVFDENSHELPKKGRRLFVSPHKHFKRFWRFWLGLGRNERFSIIAAMLLIFGAGAIGWFYFIQPKPEAQIIISRHVKAAPKAPLTLASPLTGVQVDPALTNRPVTGIMIENSVFARPQSGLQDAGVVYEAIAEGGITRFLALFQEAQPQYVGPVRSLRPYYIDFAAPFQASIAHVGGSPEALARVRNGSYRDIDQFFNSGFYYRNSLRAAPHNVYTSFSRLDTLNHAKGYTSSTFTVWPRKADKKLAIPTAKSIDVQISSPDYYSHYDYEAASNTYVRNEGGAPHLELTSANDRTGVRIAPKVIITMVMGYSIAADRQHSVYGDTGSGQAMIFQDGGVTNATWVKPDQASQIAFMDANNQPIKLNTGQTWLTLVAAPNKVIYKP
jgi:hypothetical protein